MENLSNSIEPRPLSHIINQIFKTTQHQTSNCQIKCKNRKIRRIQKKMNCMKKSEKKTEKKAYMSENIKWKEKH